VVALSSIHGFPRIGPGRELKFATEAYWAGRVSADDLQETTRSLRRDNWAFMRDAGIELIPSNDFSLYDHVLDAIALVGAVPRRYGRADGPVELDTYFAMARGGPDVTAMEMTKWFDTNYHYIVPELGPDTTFALSDAKPFDEFTEARELGVVTRPVLVGPVTFLLLGRPAEGAGDDFDRLTLLDGLLDLYAEVLRRLGELGAEWVALDEPAFVADRSSAELDALRRAYERLGAVAGRPRLCLSTYFGHAGDAVPVLAGLPIEGIGLDFHRGRSNRQLLQEAGGLGAKTLFAGVVDGRNVWINDLEGSLALLDELSGLAGDVVVSTSCSLVHVPISLGAEPGLDEEVRAWMAFAREKVGEVAVLADGLQHGAGAISDQLQANHRALESRRTSQRTRNPAVRDRAAGLTADDARRASPFEARRETQREWLGLPPFPTTTIGSYPQTPDIRDTRIRLRRGEIDVDDYRRLMRDEIERVVRLQDKIGLDVLVHGEPERNDMVQYFAEQMDGYVSTENAWVQSYGSRYVRPPILYGDVSRPEPITIDWITHAQSLTDKPVKGMLTGPVTMLQWSFVRDDQPRAETCKQLALAIRDEVLDLEAAGIKVIQVDEPAIREGLPLKRELWAEYLGWAVFSFRLATAGVADATQIHTHMCYSEFRDIMDQISGLDADVLLIWHARSQMELLDYWKARGYDKDIAPGVYDIHSPRVPSTEEMADMLRQVAEALPVERLWVAPDCGLKTRRYEEIEPALRNMVRAARQLRQELEPAAR
jgi:5-methyltetrahydropteroyltriglutamate--homocysteine methyltransferase